LPKFNAVGASVAGVIATLYFHAMILAAVVEAAVAEASMGLAEAPVSDLVWDFA
jgi:hypothetical protein